MLCIIFTTDYFTKVYDNFSSVFLTSSFLVSPVAIHVSSTANCFQSRVDLRYPGNLCGTLALFIR